MKRAYLKADKNNGRMKVHAETATDLASDFASPEFHATLTQALTCEKGISDRMDLKQLREEITRACDGVNTGDMRLPERMALAQAHTLNHLFNVLTQRAFANLGATWFEPYMRLALRAQAQSARTLETLAALKSPTIFAKQLNVANQQVVTNGAPPVAAIPSIPEALPEPRPIVRFAKSEILTRAHERVERRTAQAASRADSKLATVATIHRPAHRGRQGPRLAECIQRTAHGRNSARSRASVPR